MISSALSRLGRQAWMPLVALAADHESLPPSHGDQVHPFRFLSSSWLGEVCELAEVVNFYVCPGRSDLAARAEEPVDQLVGLLLAVTGLRSVRVAVRCLVSGMPPKRAPGGSCLDPVRC